MIGFEEWTQGDLETVEGTVGGDTYRLNGTAICYAFTRSHFRAVRALTSDKSSEYRDIKDAVVDELESKGEIQVDTSDCWDEFGWLGARVYDGEGEYIGAVGTRCSQPAGHGTDHVGTGRCKHHGGGNITARVLALVTHGQTSKHLRTVVQDKIAGFLSDPAPLDLSKELATQRALLQFLMDHYLNQGDVEAFVIRIPGIIAQLESISKAVDRAATVEKRYTLTAAQVLYVQQVFVDIINRYVPSPLDRERIAKELRERLGASASEARMALQPSAYVESEVFG